MLWSHFARGRFWTGAAKEWSALIAWVLYVALIVARRRSGWGGRRAALVGVVGFAAVVFVFVWMTTVQRAVGAAP
jgi:ABC-type transport system involved in cytochrome c biogenesis permease subunit